MLSRLFLASALVALLMVMAPSALAQNNPTQVTVSFAGVFNKVAEGGATTILVRLNKMPGRQVVIPLTVTHRGGATSADYSGVPASLTFGNNDVEKSFRFMAISDGEDDGESVLLRFGTPLPTGVSLARYNQTSLVRISDGGEVMARFGSEVYHATEGGSATTINVELSAEPGREVVIPLTVTHRGGATSADYSDVPASLTFESNDTIRSFTFAATSDGDDDGESVRLGFGAALPTGVSVGREATATVWINDGNRVSLGLAQVGMGVTAVIGNIGNNSNISNMQWQWQRSDTETGTYNDIPPAEGGVSNPYTPSEHDLGMWLKAKVTYDVDTDTGKTAQGIALQPVLAQPVVSNTGHNTGLFVGYIAEFQQTEPFRFAQGFTTGPDTRGYQLTGVRLALNAGAFYGGDWAGAWGVHADDAGKPNAEPLATALPIGNAELDENPDSLVELTLPNGMSLRPNTKYWIVTSQTSPWHEGALGIGALADFDQSYPVEEGSVTPYADPGSGDGWSIDLDLLAYFWDFTGQGNPFPALDPWTKAIHAFEVDNRLVLRMALLVVPDVNVQYDTDSYTVNEGNTLAVTVRLSADPQRTLTIPITATGEGGASAADYELPDSVTFNAGETSKAISFTVTQDMTDDDDERVKLAFGTMPDIWVTKGATEETVVSIMDDDDPPVTVSFGSAAYSVAESDDADTADATENVVTVTVTLSADPERSVTIPLTKANQGGATSADYSGVPANVVFASGETSKTFVFTANDDTVDDDGESVKLTFGTLPARVTEGTTKQTVVSITDDDDPAVTVSFGSSAYSVAESDDAGTTEVEEHKVTVTVSLSADPERTVAIPLTATNQEGATSADYSGVPQSVTFNSGENFKSFTFTATSDTIDDDGESVLLSFRTLPHRVSAGATATTTVSITDDDDPTVTANFGAAAYSVAESDDAGTSNVEENKVTVTVTLDADPERTVAIPLTATNQEGATSADYSGVPQSVTFDSGETSKSFTFTATSDTIDDDGESVQLSFGILPPRVNTGATATTTVSIADDDDPTVTANFGAAAYSVAEGSTTGLTVTLNADPERTVAIPLTATNQGGASSADYSGVPQSVTFDSGETSKSFTFTATSDSVVEHGESVLLAFGALPPAVQAGPISTARVNIGDAEAGFGASAYTVAEGGRVSVTVRLSTALPRSVTIPIKAVGQGGATGDDYSGVPQGIAFAAGETAKTFTFMAEQDKSDDDGESVRLSLGPLQGIAAGRHATATVAIRDDDTAKVEVSTDSLTIPEGSSREYTVWLATVPDDTVVVTPRSSNPSVTFVPPTLTYTPDAWAVPQTVRAFAGGGGRVRSATLTHAVTGYGIVTEAPPVAVRIQLRPTPTPTPRPRPLAIPTPAPVVLPPWVPAAPEPTATPTASPTPSPTPTATPSPTPSPFPTPTPVPVVVAAPTYTPTPTVTPTPTPAATPTPLPIVEMDEPRNGWWLWLLLLLLALLLAWIVYRRWRRRKRRWGERRWYG